MKKRCLLVFLLLFAFIIFGCTTQEQTKEKVPESFVEENPFPDTAIEPPQQSQSAEELKEEPIIKEEPVIVEPEPVVEKKEEFRIFSPVLTYDGAYNGPLYGTSEQVGSASMDSYFKNLDRNGINFFIGMFGISGEPTADALISDHGLGEVIAAAQKHPYRVIPFFNPGIGGEEVEQHLGEKLTGMYTNTLSASQKIVGKSFIRGFGEVETQEWSVRHNDPKVRQLIDLAQNNNINFMFHPVAGKIDDVEKIIEAYPDTIFLVHMYREDLDNSMDKLIKLLQMHDNLYFSIDAAHIIHVNGNDIIYSYDSTNKQSSINKFIFTFDSKEKLIIKDAITAYKPLVDAVPDKVMWGTEMGPEYAFDPEVFDRSVKISRFVIAGFNREHQEGVGYKNALRVFGEGVTADANIKVVDTRSWPECTEGQISGCNEECAGENSETAEFSQETDSCFIKCIIALKCREVPEMDIG